MELSKPKITICLLTYGDYFELARRTLESIWQNCERADYRLIVGANEVGRETLNFLLSGLEKKIIDELLVSSTNISKCPMMRQMFTKVETDLIWWFDDDSFITAPSTLARWRQAADLAPAETVVWGQAGWCGHRLAFTDVDDPVEFVRSATWYRGLPPPSWRPGGKGEFYFEGQNRGDGRWFFIFGGCWLIRTSTVRILDWPDRRLTRHGDDAFLGEAIRQHGWAIGNIGTPGVAMNTRPRRGASVPQPTLQSGWPQGTLSQYREL